MARFQSAEPNGVAVQQLEVLVRTAVFQSANQVVAYLLQQAADRIDALVLGEAETRVHYRSPTRSRAVSCQRSIGGEGVRR